jgi:hypothetical protein
MQKVVGSSPIIRYEEGPVCGPFAWEGAGFVPAPS